MNLLEQLLQPFDCGYYTGLLTGIVIYKVVMNYGYGLGFIGAIVLLIAVNLTMRILSSRLNND